MIERLPVIEVTLPVSGGRPACVTWNGELIEPEELKFDDDGNLQVVIAGVTCDEYNAELHWRKETIYVVHPPRWCGFPGPAPGIAGTVAEFTQMPRRVRGGSLNHSECEPNLADAPLMACVVNRWRDW